MLKWIRMKIYRYRCRNCGHCFLCGFIVHRCERCKSGSLVEE